MKHGKLHTKTLGSQYASVKDNQQNKNLYAAIRINKKRKEKENLKYK